MEVLCVTPMDATFHVCLTNMSNIVYKYNGVETSLAKVFFSAFAQSILNGVLVWFAWNYGIAPLGAPQINAFQAFLIYVFGQAVFTDKGVKITPTA
jgi:hypothetical protein